ncbi:hypothetical protein EGW08_021180, partial [Elysia chlorotica]
MATGSSSIVEDWLRSLGLVQYTQPFLDNGYDDLEVCKQIGEADLAAIGVCGGEHMEQLLGAVKVLREEGGAAVYFTLEESPRPTKPMPHGDARKFSGSPATAPSTPSGRGASGAAGASSLMRMDAYELGKSALVKFPSVQLKLILRDKLVENNIDLSGPPYT